MDIQSFLDRLEKVKPSQNGWTARCPGHEDKAPSLSVGQGDDGRILIRCFAGCPPEQIVGAMGLKMSDLMPESEPERKGLGGRRPQVGDEGPIGRVEAVYEYPDGAGTVSHLVARYRTAEGKSFRPFHVEGGVWKMGAGTGPWPLYHLPELLEALSMERAVWLVEGEKCAEAVIAAGLTATTSHGGANGWRAGYAKGLAGADVIISPDKDEAGEGYARAAADSLDGVARSVRIVRLSGLEEHGDVFDFLAAGKTAKDLEREAAASNGGGLVYEPPEGLWLGYAEMLQERLSVGTRFATGLRLFDAKLEGGLYPGVVVAIQGPPAAGKTGLATQIALNLARAGCAVGALFADEGLSGAAIMVGQQLGANRVPLMAGEEESTALAVREAEGLPFFKVMRPSHHKATLEEFAKGFDALAPKGMQRVWLLDSAQTLRLAKAGNGRESQFDRIARAVELVRDLTLDLRAITLLVSRVNRSAYAKKKEEERSDPLGSSWGVALEYFVELLVNLEGKPTVEKPRTVLRVSKNRISALGNFVLPLDMDFPRHGFREIDPRVDDEEKEAARLATLETVKGRILTALAGRDGVSGSALEKELKGKAATVREARGMLAVDGKIHAERRKGAGGGENWYLGPAPPPRTEAVIVDLFGGRETGKE
jgi:hypothetical protein